MSALFGSGPLEPHLGMMLLRRGGQKISARKFRLYVCACCRRAAHLLTDERGRTALELAEQAADGKAKRKQLGPAVAAVYDALAQLTGSREDVHPYQAALFAVAQAAAPKTFNWGMAWRAAATASGAVAGHIAPVTSPAFNDSVVAEHQAQAEVFWHIIGNPAKALPPLPSAVSGLAESVYASEGSHFALCDALVEAGVTDLAAHFREPYHPKGCWALDLLLGRS